MLCVFLQAKLPNHPQTMNEFIDEKLIEQRQYKKAVEILLHQEVRLNTHAFIEGMRLVQDIHGDVTLASIHVKNSRHKLAEAKMSLVLGTLGIAYRKRRSERLTNVLTRLETLRDLAFADQQIAKLCMEHKYEEAVTFFLKSSEDLKSQHLTEYAILPVVKNNFERVSELLLRRLDVALDSQCIKFDPVIYSSILGAFKALDDAGITPSKQLDSLNIPNRSTSMSMDASAADGSQGASSVTSATDTGVRDGTTLLSEVGNSFQKRSKTKKGSSQSPASIELPTTLSIPGVRKLESYFGTFPTRLEGALKNSIRLMTREVLYSFILKDITNRLKEAREKVASGTSLNSTDREDKASDNTAQQSSRVSDLEDELAKQRRTLISLHYSDLCARIEANDLPAVCVQMCAVYVHMMHQHYLLLQFHRAPNDPRMIGENGMVFLHRCKISDVEGVDTPALDELPTGKMLPIVPPLLAIIKHLRNFLIPGRHLVWQYIQHRHTTLLNKALAAYSTSSRSSQVLSTVFPVHKLASCLLITRDLMVCASDYLRTNPTKEETPYYEAMGLDISFFRDPNSTLRTSLQLFLTQYSDALTLESLERLKSLISRETWNHIPISSAEYKSMLQKTLGGIKYTYSKNVASAFSEAVTALSDPSSGALAELCEQAETSGDSFGAHQSLRSSDKGSTTTNLYAPVKNALSGVHAYTDSGCVFKLFSVRGNPFGYVVVDEHNCSDDLSSSGDISGPGAGFTTPMAGQTLSIPKQISGASALVLMQSTVPWPLDKGLRVLETPRPLTLENQQGDVYDDSDSEDEGQDSNPKDPRNLRISILSEKRRSRHNLHGIGYMLKVGLGRGDSLWIQQDNAQFIAQSGAIGIARKDSNASGLSDFDEGESDNDSITSDMLSQGYPTTDDEKDEQDHTKKDAENRRNIANNAYHTIFDGQHHHTITISALNGFIAAVSKQLLLLEAFPPLATAAFTGVARLFEMYLYSVVTLLLPRLAKDELFNLPTPTPATGAPPPAPVMNFLDGSTFHVAAHVTNAVSTARALDKQIYKMDQSRFHRRLPPAPTSFHSFSKSSNVNVPVTVHGVTLHTRGLHALAQAQELSPDHYISGPGAKEGELLNSGVYSHPALFITLRRALQQIGFALTRNASTSSSFVEGEFMNDTNVSSPGIVPPLVTTLCPAVDLNPEAGYGLSERAVAVESLDFLIDILNVARSRFEANVPSSFLPSIQLFFSRAVLCAMQIKGLIYQAVAGYILHPGASSLDKKIKEVRWYVDSQTGFHSFTFLLRRPLQYCSSDVE